MTAQAIYIIFACYSRIMRHFKMDTLGTDLVSGQWSGVRGQGAVSDSTRSPRSARLKTSAVFVTT